jgi:S-ribosylhomocysteine lyase LuxS involved in autoinducer biosynthesis
MILGLNEKNVLASTIRNTIKTLVKDTHNIPENRYISRYELGMSADMRLRGAKVMANAICAIADLDCEKLFQEAERLASYEYRKQGS